MIFEHIKRKYNIHCPNTKYDRKYFWRFIILDLLAMMLGVYFEVNNVKFGTNKNNPLKTKN